MDKSLLTLQQALDFVETMTGQKAYLHLWYIRLGDKPLAIAHIIRKKGGCSDGCGYYKHEIIEGLQKHQLGPYATT